VGAAIFEAKQVANIRAEEQTLRQEQSEQNQQFQKERDEAKKRLASLVDQSSRTNKDNSELLKLRGQVGVLQIQADQAAKNSQVAEENLKELLSAKSQFTKHEATMVNNAKQIGLAMLIYSGDNDSRFPTDFIQLTNELGDVKGIQKMDVYSFDLINISSNGVVQGFDSNNFSKSAHPDLVVVRETTPRQATDGSWSRIYGLLDGRVLTANSYDGNFEVWEKVNTYSPPPNQNQ
jgi:hypothetical protein